MTKAVVSVAALAAVLCAASSAFASVCVVLDEERDTLGESDRRAAMIILRGEFEDEGQEVVDSGCDTTYTVYHVQLGESVTVFLEGGGREEEMDAASIEELRDVYSQIVRAILGRATTTTRDNATSDQDAPRRVQADDLGYVRLGYGAFFADELRGGPSLGGGYRYELNRFAVDATVGVTFQPDASDEDEPRLFGVSGGIGMLYFFNGLADISPYIGGGLAYSLTTICGPMMQEGECIGGNGLALDVRGGVEMLRSSTIRFFTEGAFQVPFYDLEDSATDDRFYAPSFAISLGIAFGRPQSRAIRIY